MNRNFLQTAALAVGLALSLPTLAESFDPGVAPPQVAKDYYAGSEKVVYHISTGADQKGYLGMMGNVRNHMNALTANGLKPQIKVVLNGDGLGLLKLARDLEFEADARLPGAIKDLKDKGVEIQICYNTLTARKITLAELFDAKPADVVPAGVAEVARLESKGYQMIKP